LEILIVIASALLVSGAVVWAATQIVREIAAARDDAKRGRMLQVLAAFGPAMSEAAVDPRAYITWQPIAVSARRLMPSEFAALDAAAGGAFPFTGEQIRDAHSRWTAEWLAWEQAHDTEFKLKAAAAEHDLAASGGAPLARAHLETIEREKLERYQRRYEEYIRIARKLQSLSQP
jgi:hypothetical protein